jgi:spore germination cell wall hydrolase CwlJ-like protein
MKYIIVLLLLFIPLTATTDLVDVPVDMMNEYRCMKIALHHEARGETIKGIQAVANVIMNRVTHEKFPNSVCGVIYQKDRSVCQFSWHCKNKQENVQNIDFKVKFLAFEAVVNGTLKDLTGGALWFHSGQQTDWFSTRKMTRQIGRHKFYR